MTSQAIVMIFLALLAIAGGIIAYLLKKKRYSSNLVHKPWPHLPAGKLLPAVLHGLPPFSW